jgi:hypothetical protein
MSQMSLKDWLGQLQATQEAPQTLQERAQTGRAAQGQGAGWERACEREAALAGLRLWKVPTPTQILRREARAVICRLEEATAPDYLGVAPDGAAVALEVKSCATAGASWALPARLLGHQGAALAAVAASGGRAAVLLWWGGAVSLLPWPEADPRPGRVSIPVGEVARFRVAPGASWARALGDAAAWQAWRGRWARS